MQQKSYCKSALFVKRYLVDSSMKLRHAAPSLRWPFAGVFVPLIQMISDDDALPGFAEATVDRNLVLYYTCRLWFELLKVEGSNDVYQTNLAAKGATPQTRTWLSQAHEHEQWATSTEGEAAARPSSAGCIAGPRQKSQLERRIIDETRLEAS